MLTPRGDRGRGRMQCPQQGKTRAGANPELPQLHEEEVVRHLLEVSRRGAMHAQDCGALAAQTQS